MTSHHGVVSGMFTVVATVALWFVAVKAAMTHSAKCKPIKDERQGSKGVESHEETDAGASCCRAYNKQQGEETMSVCGSNDERYSRQKLILGWEGQHNVELGSCLIIGCGGLASGCIPLLAGGGVGKIGLCDPDVVEMSNLHRQTIHSTETTGHYKVDSARAYIKRLNPLIVVETYLERINLADRLMDIVQTGEYDVVVDCSDNMETRYIVNRACVLMGKPLVSASALGTFGQLAVFWPLHLPQAGCYQCAFPGGLPADQGGNCSSEGVIGPLPSILGAFQALETLKLLAYYVSRGRAEAHVVGDAVAYSDQFRTGGVLMTFDLANLLQDAISTVKLKRDKKCPVCGDVIHVVQPRRKANVQEAVTILQDWFVVDVRPRTTPQYSRANMKMDLTALRTNPKTAVSQILAAAGATTAICFVCRQGVTSRVAASIFSHAITQDENNVTSVQVFTLQGGIGA